MSSLTEISHINHALLAKGHPRRHLIHKFWARKPHNVVAEYIKHYSKEGEIVLDPFVGSGVTATEALILGRKTIAIDLNPIATFITKMIMIPANLESLKDVFEKIKENVVERINSLYETQCPSCKKQATIICSIWERHKEVPEEIRLFCPYCKRKYKKPSPEDIQKIKDIQSEKIPYWIPEVSLRYPNGVEYKEGTHIEQVDNISKLFTKRNLIALSILYHEIESLKSGVIKDLMKISFTSMVHLASNMTPVRPTRPYSSFWAVHRYWIPPKFMESNVWMLFESAIKGRQGLLKGKNDSNEKIKFYKEARRFEDLKKDANILISTQSALDLSNIPENSVDYVFTDPPYGGDIQYFELSTLWLAWLRGEHEDERFNLDWWEDEITINPQQRKDFNYYHNRLHVTFREIYRVLKPGRFLTVTFHNTDVKVYNSIIRAEMFAGFELEKIIYQPPARASAKALLQPYGSAIGDYYIRFRKPEVSMALIEEREVDEVRAKRIILEAIKKILIERGEPIPLTDILKGHTLIYNELKKHGYRFFGANLESIGHVLEENKDKEFIFIKGEGWWFKDPRKHHLHTPLNERVEAVILDTLYRKIASFDDVLQDIYLTFTNAQTPNPPSVRMLIEEYAEKKGGKWKLKPQLKVREREHNEMIGFLAEIGNKMDYKVWIGEIEQPRTYQGKPLSRLCDLKTLILEGASPDDINAYLKRIDVLWVKEGKVKFAFEVEYTTAVTEAFIRCSNIPKDHNSKKFIVIPEEREKLLYRKLNSRLLKERVKEEGWRIIFFKNLRKFYNENKRKRKISSDEILTLATIPQEEGRMKQGSLEPYVNPA